MKGVLWRPLPDRGTFFLLILAVLWAVVWPLWRYQAYLSHVLSAVTGELSWVRQGELWLERQKEKRAIGLGALDQKGAFLEIERLATLAGVTMESVRSAGTKTGQGLWFYDEFLLDLSGRGDETALFSFTRSLVAGNRIWRLRECDLRSGTEKGGAVAGRWKIGVLGRVRRAAHAPRLAFRDIFEEPVASAWPITGRRVFLQSVPSAPREILASSDHVKDFILVAVIDDGSPRAALEDRRTNRSLVVRPGDVIEGMNVVEVGHGSLVLEAAGVIHRLSL